MKQRLFHFFRYLFLAVGLCLLVLLIHRIGWPVIVQNILRIGWWFIPILAVSFVWYMLYTNAWRQFLQRLSRGIPFWDLFRIKITGEAVNTLTPANFIGGDPVRIYLLKKTFSVSEGAASVVVDRTLQSTAVLVVIILGIVVGFVNFEAMPMNIKFGVPIAMLVSVGFMAFVFIHQRKGFFSMMLHACRRMGIKRSFSEKTVQKFADLDSHIIDFYQANHRGFWVALACHISGRLLGVVEVYLIGRVVSPEFTLFTALMLSALSPVINIVFAFIPGAFGVMEGAYSGVLYLMHMDPAIGITVQIAKRLRAGFWILLGLVFLGAHDRKKVLENEDEMIEESIS